MSNSAVTNTQAAASAGDRLLDSIFNLQTFVLLAGVLLSILTAVFAWRQVMEARSQRTAIFLNIADRWTLIYEDRLKIMQLEHVTEAQLETEYGANYRALFEKDFWLPMRAVLNFFEVIGVMIHRRYIGEKEVFVLVSVDYYPRAAALEELRAVHGDLDPSLMATLYCRLRPYLLYLRKHYRADIYEFYDDYLLKRYWKNGRLRPHGLLQRLRMWLLGQG